jgi:hypothetical protein
MAQGDVTIFNAAIEKLMEKKFDFEAGTWKLGLITASLTPAATTADPCWGAGGSTNLTTYQVTPGGNYSTGGPTLANPAATLTGGVCKFVFDAVSIAQDASNPTTARWGVIYEDTATNKDAWAYVDLGGVTDLSAGGFSMTPNASGLHDIQAV